MEPSYTCKCQLEHTLALSAGRHEKKMLGASKSLRKDPGLGRHQPCSHYLLCTALGNATYWKRREIWRRVLEVLLEQVRSNGRLTNVLDQIRGRLDEREKLRGGPGTSAGGLQDSGPLLGIYINWKSHRRRCENSGTDHYMYLGPQRLYHARPCSLLCPTTHWSRLL